MDESSTPKSATVSPASSAARVPWWQRPVVLALLLTLVLLAALAWPLLGAMLAPPAASERSADVAGLPWGVQPDGAGGSRVFGLHLGVGAAGDTLAQVQTRFADDVSVAILAPMGEAAAGQPLALEAYVDNFRAGFITGKLVLAFEADAAWLAQARSRSPGNEVSGGAQTRRYKLALEDQAPAAQTRLVALSFVPAARLDEAVVVQRFGKPAERLAGAEAGALQLLYPAVGVSVAVPPAEGEAARARALIQYVAPAQFDARLRAPLQAAASAALTSR